MCRAKGVTTVHPETCRHAICNSNYAEGNLALQGGGARANPGAGPSTYSYGSKELRFILPQKSKAVLWIRREMNIIQKT